MTHALAGLTIAAWARRGAAPADAAYPRYLAAASMLANNVNDFDAAYARRLGGKFGYLLHHRGHSHTLPIALLLGIGVFCVFAWFARRRGWSRRDLLWLLAACVLGPFVHVALDFCNNYGVHPFWPLDSRWFYGDTLFIIEPWLWVVAVPALAADVKWLYGRVLLFALLGVALLLAWLMPWVAAPVAALLTLGGVASIYAVSRLTRGGRLGLLSAGWVCVLLAFSLGSRSAKAELHARWAELGPPGILDDVALTPAPGNPLCFSAVLAAHGATDYVASAARVSAWPSLVSAARCRVQPTGLTLGLAKPAHASSRAVVWEGEWSRPLDELVRLPSAHCGAAAFLRFARVPFWGVRAGRLLLGDLRFDRDTKLDFDEFLLEPREACPRWVPPWVPPRAALLRP